MTRYVIDAPTLLHLIADDVPIGARHQIDAPNLIRSQALFLLLEAVQRGDRVSRRTAWKIAREQGWETTYDAEYLAVTRLQADALITVDGTLAAKAEDVVPLAPLEALTEES